MSEVKTVNWKPIYKKGDVITYKGEKAEVLYQAVNKSYFLNVGGKLVIVEEKEINQ